MSRIDGPAVGASPGSRVRDGGANRQFKERFGGVFRKSLVLAASAHVVVLLLNPGWGALDEVEEVFAPPATELITLPMSLDLPKPPEPMPRPVAPVTELEVPDDLTMEPVAFETYDDWEIPPPPTSAREEFADYRHFMPFMVAPELQNRDEVKRALERAYPRGLQNVGIGGRLVVWFWINEDGHVVNYEIKVSSGREELDRAAEEVIEMMEFSPAFHRNRTVPVIVSLPIVFETN